MVIQFILTNETGIEKYAQQLNKIEASISYPLTESNDHFTITHGSPYHTFFSTMGKTRFIVVLDNGAVIGLMVGVWKPVTVNGQSYTALYLADLKLSEHYRGKKIIHRMLWFAFTKWLTSSDCRGWDFIFSAAMQRDCSDVTQSFHGAHLGKLLKISGKLDLYFCSCKELLSLNNQSPLLPSLNHAACLSQADSDIRNNAGRKDLNLQSTGKSWPLIHLTIPSKYWSSDLGRYLKLAVHKQASISNSVILCFSLDSRLIKMRQWLASNNIRPGATCAIYSCPNTLLGSSPINNADFIHLDTSQI